MRYIRRAGLVIAMGALCVLPAGGQNLTRDQVLDRIDSGSAKLRTLRADIEVKNWTDLLEEFDAGERGHISIRKGDGKTSLRRQIDLPQQSILLVQDGQALFYRPAIKEAVRYDINQGKNKPGSANLFVGFGTGKDALLEKFEIELSGTEKISGKETYVLEMTPRDERARAEYSQFVIWVDPDRGIPLRQVIRLPNNDYQQIDFGNIEINKKIADSEFRLDLPSDVVVKTL